jgi:hypothetical protein
LASVNLKIRCRRSIRFIRSNRFTNCYGLRREIMPLCRESLATSARAVHNALVKRLNGFERMKGNGFFVAARPADC